MTWVIQKHFFSIGQINIDLDHSKTLFLNRTNKYWPRSFKNTFSQSDKEILTWIIQKHFFSIGLSNQDKDSRDLTTSKFKKLVVIFHVAIFLCVLSWHFDIFYWDVLNSVLNPVYQWSQKKSFGIPAAIALFNYGNT